MSEINPTDHKSITACHFPRDITRVEADFSIWRDYGLSKGHYPVHHVWCLDLENTKDFFERVYWSFHAIVRNFLLDLVTFKLNVTLASCPPVFFRSIRTLFQKSCHASPPTGQHPCLRLSVGGRIKEQPRPRWFPIGCIISYSVSFRKCTKWSWNIHRMDAWTSKGNFTSVPSYFTAISTEETYEEAILAAMAEHFSSLVPASVDNIAFFYNSVAKPKWKFLNSPIVG